MVERRIDKAHLVFCWQDDSPDNAYYLDLKTGDVKLVNRHLLDLGELTDEIEKSRERYLYLPKPDPKALIKDLHEFEETVEADEIKRVLPVAFESPHVLSAFRKILSKQPGEVERLNEFLEHKVLKRVNSWLKANAVPDSWDVSEEELDEESEQDDEYEWEDFSVKD